MGASTESTPLLPDADGNPQPDNTPFVRLFPGPGPMVLLLAVVSFLGVLAAAVFGDGLLELVIPPPPDVPLIPACAPLRPAATAEDRPTDVGFDKAKLAADDKYARKRKDAMVGRIHGGRKHRLIGEAVIVRITNLDIRE